MSLAAYSSLGGDLHASIDTRAFPFEDSMKVPVTIKEKRLENYPPQGSLANLNSNGGTGIGQIIFQVPATTDQTQLDLHNSMFQFLINMPNCAANQGIAQFGMNNMIQDFQLYMGSELVSEPHNQYTYPWQSFVKDVLTEKRPCCPSIAAAPSTGSSCDLTQYALEEGNYLSYPMSTTATVDGAAGTLGALALTLQFINNTSFYASFRPKDGIFLTQKYFPSDKPLRFVITVNLQRFFQENPGANTISAGGVTILDCQLLLQRVWLTDDALAAYNQARLVSPLRYVLPYSNTEVQNIPAGVTQITLASLFSGQKKPDLLAVMIQAAGNTKSSPLVACGIAYGGGVLVNQMFAKFKGVQYPDPACFPLRDDLRTYQAYVEQCLQSPHEVYLDYAHWYDHYTPYIISLRRDQEKIYGLDPSDEAGGIDLTIQFSTALATPVTAYIVELTHVKLEIDTGGRLNKIGGWSS
jgi:hypothetical protein